jgi:SOS-response transcriptional repressor LexA
LLHLVRHVKPDVTFHGMAQAQGVPDNGRVENWLAPFLKTAGVSQEALAEDMGKSRATVNRIANGHTKLTPQIAKDIARSLSKIGRATFTSKVILEAGADALEDPQRVSDDQWDPAAPDGDIQDVQADGVSTLRPYRGKLAGASPDIDVSAGAGPGGMPLPASIDSGGVVYSADAVRGEILLPPYLLSEFTRATAARIHWVAVRGDSMTPTLLPGERVMVDTTDTAIGQGGVFVLRDPDGEVLVKRLRKLKGGEIEVVSDNDRQGNAVHAANDISIIGRVVGRLGRL